MISKTSVSMLKESDLVSGSITGFYATTQELWIDAGAMLTGDSGATSTGITWGGMNMDAYVFETGSNQSVLFKFAPPNNWNGGSIKSKFFWSGPSGSGDVTWTLQGSLLGDADVVSGQWDGVQEVSDTFSSVSGMHCSSETPSITINSFNGDEIAIFRLGRNATGVSDTYNQPAYLFGTKLQLTTSGNAVAW